MRPPYSTITPAVIHQHARDALGRALPWKPFRQSVSVADLLNLLLLMAAHTASLFATVGRFFAFSHETARRALQANLPSRERLVGGLVQALYEVAQSSRQDRRRRWLLAIDAHHVAYYGQKTPAVLGGPKKQGTQWSFGYATACLLHHHRRYTVALSSLEPKTKPHQVVQTLLEQIVAQGLKIRGLALDSAFDSGETLLLLQERGLAYTVPLRRKGQGSNARNRLFEGRHRLIRWAQWTTETTRRPVKTRVLLWKGRARTMAFAFQGWRGDKARNVHQQAERQRRLYQRRFGIETSYRQKNQAQAQTTSKDPVYRLLLQGVAYLVRQVWVVLTEQLARQRRAKPTAWVGALPLALLLDWLADHLETLYREERSIPLAASPCAP
jgi:Transposase DDE domain